MQIPQHCREIGEYLVIDGLGVRTCCCGNSVKLPSSGNIDDDLDSYFSYCEKLRTDLNEGKQTSCIGCHMLSEGRFDGDLKIKRVNLSTGLPGGIECNFNCSYCTYGKTLGASAREDSVYDIMLKLGGTPSVEKITYACGEITVSPYRDEILSLWKSKKWGGTIYINAAVYNDLIAELLSTKNVNINVSLDAGTSHTFNIIKNVDCFDKVKTNIRKYAATGGNIFLKYILLEGINDNKEDIKCFISFVNEINARVVIAKDNRKRKVNMSEAEYSMFLYMVKLCKDNQIQFSIIEDYFAPDLESIKSNGVYTL